jgi:hypothetical protein
MNQQGGNKMQKIDLCIGSRPSFAKALPVVAVIKLAAMPTAAAAAKTVLFDIDLDLLDSLLPH